MQARWWVVAGTAAVIGLAACGKKNEYPEGVRQVTYRSCVDGFKKTAGARPGVDERSAAYCTCVLDSLQKTVPLNDFTAYERMLTTNETGPERSRIEKLVGSAVTMCIDQELKK